MNKNEIKKHYVTDNNESFIIDFLSKFFDPIGYRKSGRSTVLAKAFVSIAYRYPMEWIQILDHYPYKMARENTMQILRLIVNPKFFVFRVESFKYNADKAGLSISSYTRLLLKSVYNKELTELEKINIATGDSYYSGSNYLDKIQKLINNA